ncbi:MAG TPA: DUF503 domain-containing protein [Thermoanaerobacterales bacterium]|jgi:uncharacterized protein YlxP (DUF503 family)|nr:DUF503 domain-containing protein [Thermoanaerobacterales bacterium]
MIVGLLTVEIFLGDIFSLKEKRQVVKSIIERLKNRYNVSIAEVEKMDDKRRAVIGMACVSNSSKHVNKQLDNILNFMEIDGRFFIEDIYKEML